MNEFLSFAEQVAREAGAILRERFGAPLDVRRKGRIDLVTEVDVLAENLIRSRIQRRFPDHAILAEESGLVERASAFRWIIDPLDGTTNYSHGYPFFSVAIALEQAGETVVGVVYDPLRDELFAAARGQGTTCNGHPVRVSAVPTLEQALLVTGFPYNVRSSPRKNLDHFSAFLEIAQAIRRDGSAALDLAYVAMGRFDGFWELNLAPWDMAAGSLLVTEAGGRVTAFDGQPFSPYVAEIVASNGLLHDAMCEVLRASARTSE
ncbi:MAG: inositol monophosphatase [Chloracidobacterium sp.]|nr:inositol monophosphatase [Chloracidobacterium sp.]MDW8218100.1 inositol monophosphatase family protein [Acidobacteriota bacterium]